jgi:hypothetical protein
MEKKSIVLAVVLAAILIPAMAFAQACNFDLQFDQKSVQTISGTVITTIDYNLGNPVMGPRSVLVSSGNQVYNVFLGPSAYANQIGFSPRSGDTVTVTGSSRTISGQPYIVASTVSLANKTYEFRNACGVPAWSGQPLCGVPTGAGPSMPEPVTEPAMAPAPAPVPAIAPAPVPFDPNNIITVSGKITSLSQQIIAGDTEPSLVAVVKSDANRNSIVLLGPASFLAANGINVAVGNEIFVRGSLVSTNTGKMVVGMIVRQGENALSLRTVQGAPLWTPSATSPSAPMTTY